MKQETNNEIDLLLRRMSRRNGDSMGDARTDIDDHHLDADELSSYAQNALPPATHARYTEHLAECSTCRRIATQLALSLGTTVPAAETVPAPSGLKAFLASLFTPMVLRYAVPALGLIIVAAIGFVVMRQQGSQPLSARVNEEQKAARPPDISAQPEGRVAPLAIESPKENAKADSANPQKPAREESAETAPQSKTAAATAGTGPAPAKAPETAAEAPPTTAAPTVAETKLAAASGKETEKHEDEAASKKQSAPAPAAQTASVPLVRDRKDDARDNLTVAGAADNKAKGETDSRGFMTVRPGTGTGGTATAKRSRSERFENKPSTDRAETNETVETRSVAGRNFRKQRGIWVDTEYDSSTQTVNMARGSEQFRALVADEPTIGTIVKQLEGEVIVVWKGRAYRIR
jgi:hypothetical protein